MVATSSSPTTPTSHPRLTPAEVADFRREGYHIHRKPVFAPAKFQRLKDTFENILNGLESGVRPESMDVPHFQHPELFEWLFADEVLDLVEPILGPDIALFASHFICKPKGNGQRVPWHEDSHYWKTMITPMEVVTVWLAIDPATTENGCMRIIPRTHNTGKEGFSDYDQLKPGEAVFNDEITTAQRDPNRAVAIELEPNQCSLHDGRIIHGSEPNLSTKRRCGYTMRYISTRVRENHEQIGSWHHLYLARGKDLSGNVYGDPTKAYPELARFRAKHGKNGH
ncbi:MAG: hypothetical protein JWM35_1428 [Verrucomicrobia bacterium]|nr:hypothetical protein [Verrucomicrobiota bacterium]